MKLIRELSERIEEEIKDVKMYAKLATREKESHPMLAETLYSISRQETEHVNRLHEGVAQIIAEYRKEHGEPPAEMLAIYNYLHEKHIEQFAEAKKIQDIYAGK